MASESAYMREDRESGMKNIHTIVDKLWGREVIVVNNRDYCGKLLILTPGYRCSLHCHRKKRETMFVLDGRVRFQYLNADKHFVTLLMKPGESFTVERGVYHRFSAIGNVGARIIEFSTPHSDADVFRLEESRAI